MIRPRHIAGPLLLLAIAACARAPQANDSAANVIAAEAGNDTIVVPQDDAAPEANDSGDAADYVGRWTGVDGMYLVVAKARSSGSYTLEMQWDLDHKGTFTGTATDDTIAFTRNGKRETLRPGSGDDTGLKYLAGKEDCLMVKPGEGYCRD